MTEVDVSKMQRARLIPATDIKGSHDQERRATSAFLAVLHGVPELTKAILKEYGVPAGDIQTFIEPEFKLDTKKVRPDGFIQITRGSKTFRIIVEVKTGKNELELSQLNDYLEIAKLEGFDMLLTISNQVLDDTGIHPTKGIDARKLRSTALVHLSWMRIISECIILSEHTGVNDSDRSWILKELIRFLQSDASGASEFNDMGTSWVSIRDGVRSGTIRKPDDNVIDVVTKFQNLVRYCALTLAARSGVEAQQVISKTAKSDGRKFLLNEAGELISKKSIKGALKIPGAASDLEILADIGSGMTHTSFEVSAPTEGKNKSRLNWILKQWKAVPTEALLSIGYKHSRIMEVPVKLSDLKSGEIEIPLDNSKEIATFRVSIVRASGEKRGRGKGAFIDSVLSQVELTYAELLQPIRPWVSSAPKLSETVVDLIPKQEASDTYANSQPTGLEREQEAIDLSDQTNHGTEGENQQP